MIDARELRIGNYVNVPRKDQCPFRIDGFEFFLFEKDYKVAMNTGTYKVDDVIGEIPMHPLTWYKKDLQPIPLSTDILERCGFVFDGDWWHLDIGNNSQITCANNSGWVDKIIEDTDYSVSTGGIKYLHQLQNLYYALTGEELKINL